MVVVVARRGSLFKLYKNLVCLEAESQIVGGREGGGREILPNLCSPPAD